MALVLLIVGFLCLILVVANRAQDNPAMRRALYALLLLVNAGFVFIYGIAPAAKLSTTAATVTPANASAALIATLIVAGLATALLFESVRQRIAPLFPRPGKNKDALEAGEAETTSGFNPGSIAQMTAMVYCVYLLGDTVLQYILAGGLTGLAEDFKTPTAASIVLQLLIFVIIAMFGAGFWVRRPLPDVLQRLGLRWPTIEEMSVGFIVGMALVVFAFTTGFVWELLTPPDVLQQQTQISQLLSEGVNTLTLALIAAAGAAIGEEIAFRGALQPVFGLWPTAIFFAMTHIQYTLTPATLLIVGVAIGFGWLRRRYNTTTSMIAHFLYDFVLFSLPIYARYLQDVFGAVKR